MFISAMTIDDLLQKTLRRVLKRGVSIESSKGNSREIIGVMLELKNPLARLSRSETKGKVFSGLGELLWYLSGKNDLDFIEYYLPEYRKSSDDGLTIYGGYGPRIRCMHGQDQISNVLKILSKRGDSRKAVIQIFDAEDIAEHHNDIPCTCVLQFFRRNDQLHMVVYMRSNDAFWGLPHDIFAFTMLQEMIARKLNIGLGSYRHSVGSLHLYDKQIDDALQYLNEGWHSTDQYSAMPPMPLSDPWEYISTLLDVELEIRSGGVVGLNLIKLPPYWKDLTRLLKIFRLGKNGKAGDIKKIYPIKRQMASDVFDIYIDTYYSRRRTLLLSNRESDKQMSIDDIIPIVGI
ncbi:thymidylate synthase [Rhodoferax lithotrophicus]|uniref:thymidylate synthase n=1 Tax=Rhodoferax lithotrophicus TaxID=2798804 RepID=A0ABM7MTT6_9BURK|nr:thymidylate synthase [Rhodoferax sp. MIZ03]BCO29791.1 thymidylate synthase [Rhodoferax sp. MIZ03]